ncbi:MAG TPA: hypothetical protein VGN32_11565 [Ktedonobacterales bacterium]|jgi:hypothetical protein|nr:hypothetical protein [Ktedonobacterales bacterium]
MDPHDPSEPGETPAELPTPAVATGDAADLSREGDPAGMLARVRFGLGKELQLYVDEFVVVQHEAQEELRLRLASLRRLILAPGEQVPSKLILMFDLDDDTTIIAAEGMSNVRDFRKLLARLLELKPALELDPSNMDEQLAQALDLKRRSLFGCYGAVIAACVVLWLVYIVVAFIGAHAPH